MLCLYEKIGIETPLPNINSIIGIETPLQKQIQFIKTYTLRLFHCLLFTEMTFVSHGSYFVFYDIQLDAELLLLIVFNNVV